MIEPKTRNDPPAPRPATAGAPSAPVGTAKRIISIRWIVTSAAVLLTAVAVLSVGAVAERNARIALTGEIESRLLLLARNLALTSSGALLGDFPELTLQPLVKETLAREPELAFVTVVDHADRIQGNADAHQLGSRFTPPPGLRPLGAGRPLQPGESLQANTDLMVASAAVPNPSGGSIGRALVGLRRGYIERRVASSRRQQALLLALFMVLGVGSAFVLMSQLLRPVGTLRAGIERIGRGDLETPIRLRDHTELGLLAEAVNEMAAGLQQAQVELVERERLAHEVDLARQIQESLLPRGPVTTGAFVVRGAHRAAAEVGGDYYDVLPLPDWRVALAIADVAGKGLAGCLVMSMLSALLRALRNAYTSPAALLSVLDERLGESLRPGVFVTMFYGILDPATGRLVFASAGHNPMLLCRRSEGRTDAFEAKGLPLASVRGGAVRASLCDEVVQMRPGDVMLQFTDGYSEAFDAAHSEEFGVGRIEGALTRLASEGGEAVRNGLDDSVREWSGTGPPGDDQTLLVVTCAADAPELVTGLPPATAAGGRDEPLARLAAAERSGHALRLSASLDSMKAIREWLRRTPDLRDLSPDESELLGSALYEACANIAEHGFGEDGSQQFELWWLPPAPDDVAGFRAEQRARRGRFVIRDDGTPFRPDNREALDFSNPGVRRRGRGLGLEIIHRVMSHVEYHPATPRGNVTLLTFGPRRPAALGKGVSP